MCNDCNDNADSVTKVVVHMYRIGTGDCFVLKFMKGDEVTFKMLIDCGCWKRKFADIRTFVEEIKKDVDNHVHVLVITHEHTDHVLGFEAGKALFTDPEFTVDRIWMGWTEDDEDEKVKKWKKDYGEKKLALGIASQSLAKALKSPDLEKQFKGSRHRTELLGLRRQFSSVLEEFAELHLGESFSVDEYKGSLKGMAVVKEQIAGENLSYFKPGELIENLPGLEGMRIFVLGPPTLHEEVKKEHGDEGESFEHNKEIEDSDLFVHAMNAVEESDLDATRPFEKSYVASRAGSKIRKAYEDPANAWRRIDYDWLFSSGSFALRMNSLTNNLSLALAFESKKSGRVMLFPGDAEFGSWKSWQEIDWESKVPGLTTEKLLNRVVFYKVAHHLSHNGTARSVGLDMMTSPELSAMATLDYDVISSGWKSTMPNRLIVKELLEKTKGRFMIMNTKGLHYDLEGEVPLTQKIEESRQKMTAEERAAFNKALDEDSEFYTEYVLPL